LAGSGGSRSARDGSAVPLLVSFAALIASVFLAYVEHAEAQETKPPDIVLIITDDQRADTLAEMPTVQRELVAHGVLFENGVMGNPTCCPSRATYLTGLTSGHNGVWTNTGEYGGFAHFMDTNTVATQLQSRGYETAFFGKYLNGYQDVEGYVPPAWNRWWAFKYCGSFGTGYVDPCIFDGTTTDVVPGYGTDLMAEEATRTIRDTPTGTPLFMHVAPTVPHSPAIPAERHEGLYQGLDPHRPPSHNEDRIGDKPLWVQKHDQLDTVETAALDQFRIDQYESIQAADDLVGNLVSVLTETGRMQDTFLLFTSDNGFLWGEHRLTGKSRPYEEAIHVPFVVRYDPLTTGTVESRLVSNLDFTPTAVDLAGGDPTGYDGLSLVPLLGGSAPTWRGEVLLEHLGPYAAPSYCGVRTPQRKFVHYETGEEELYTLGSDPYELVNKIGKPKWQETIASLREKTRQLCDPLPPGMTWPV